MNAPEEMSDREKLDWTTFFNWITRGHRMTEKEVQEQIQTPAVLEAFQRAKLSSLPRDEKEAYEYEDKEYDMYSQHTQELVDEGVKIGMDEGVEKGMNEGVQKGMEEGKCNVQNI